MNDKNKLDASDVEAATGGNAYSDFHFDIYCGSCGHVLISNGQGQGQLEPFLYLFKTNREQLACPKCGAQTITWRQID